MSNTPSLEPCPFCGAPAHGYAIAPHSHSPAVLRLVPELPDHPGCYVIEGQCACGSGLIGANESEVTARWNRRTPQQEAQEPYPIDADPQCIRAIVADAITGALAFGAQGSNPPPEGHWLTPFWEMAREEAMRTQPASVSSDTLYLLRRLLSNQHTLTGTEFRAELEKIVGEAYQQEAQEPTADVQAKIASNTWDHFGDILPTLKAISRGDWYWGANTRCKYIEIRIDTRDGGCILYDSKRVRISPQQFAHQSHDLGKMDPWPAKNVLGDTAPQPAPAPLSEQDEREAVARAIWELMREHEDRCDMELDDLMEDHPIWSYADAARAALAAQGGK